MTSSRDRRGRVRVLALVLAVLLPACGDGSANGPDRVRAMVMPYLTFMPFHIAEQEGFFAAQDLEVEFVRLPRIQELMTGLARGELDVAAGMLTTTLLNSIANGARMQLVGALGHLPADCTFSAAVARRELLDDGSLDDPERLRQLSWDVDLLIPYGFWLQRLLEPRGISIDELRVVDLPESTAVDSILTDAVDVTFVTEPFLGRLTSRPDDAALWQDFGEVVPGYQLSNLMYGPTLLDDRPDVADRFAVAMLQAIRQFAMGKTPRNLEIVADATGLTPKHVRDACWPAARMDGLIPAGAFDDYQQWMVGRGLAERVLEEDEYIEPRFLEHANEVLQ